MSEYVHQDNRGGCYQRMGDSTLKLSFAQWQELEWDRGASRFESTPVPGGGSFEEVLDPQQVEEFRALLTSSTPQLALQARDLLTRKGEVTVAAALLFAHRPQIFYPNAHVRILRYDDNDPGAGRRQNLVHGEIYALNARSLSSFRQRQKQLNSSCLSGKHWGMPGGLCLMQLFRRTHGLKV